MNDKIKIDSGIKIISITDKNNNVTGEFSFNPYDLLFMERFYSLVGEFEEELTKHQNRIASINTEKDENGLPKDALKGIEEIKETIVYLRDKIDHLFGEGTSQAAFGDVMSMEAILQFFSGVSPIVKAARSKKVDKYRPKK